MQLWCLTLRPGLAARFAHAVERACNMWHVAARRLTLCWVGNILDRDACELIVTIQSPLLEQDWAIMRHNHHQAGLAQFGPQRNAEDKAAEDLVPGQAVFATPCCRCF